MNPSIQLWGPFAQILTMNHLPPAGPIADDQLEIVSGGGILVENGTIREIDDFKRLRKQISLQQMTIHELKEDLVLMPGLIDAHTHICHAGSRASDYAKRLTGVSYQEIAKQGGGIMDTVEQTRQATSSELAHGLQVRCNELLNRGVTTVEVKSGYGLTVQDELKMLEVIRSVNERHPIDLIATALPAHICPPEFEDPMVYIRHMIYKFLPEVRRRNLARRADIYIDQNAFGVEHGALYIREAKNLGYTVTIHADQFSIGGSRLAVSWKAVSADHLEISGPPEIKLLAANQVIGTVLPGASLGLGLSFAPVRKMIDAGMVVAIASDWNPGSAPMGDLLIQACLLGAYEKLSMAELLAGITVYAARALECSDRGVLDAGKTADMIAFPCHDYREIIYRQGALKPVHVWKRGRQVK
jgi:imidazolonepropionase